MSQKYIIDGYNLIYQFHDLRQRLSHDLEGARSDLIFRLSSFAVRQNAQITVVFDGGRQGSSIIPKRAGVKVIFSRAPEKADPLIKRMIEKEKQKDQLIVISSDREIYNYARLYSVKPLTSLKFVREILNSQSVVYEQKPDPKLSNAEVEEWVRLFNQNKSREE